MKGLTAEESARYLSALAEIKGSCRLYDTHVHPYEVLFDRFSYPEAGAAGVVSMAGRTYAPTTAGALRFPEVADLGNEPRSQRLRDISVMLLGKIYGSVGTTVFADQMKLSGIDGVLLLPVASEDADAAGFERRMQWVKELYGNDGRFHIAGSVPPTLDPSGIERYVAGLRGRFGISALKCHPVVSGIDLGSPSGKEWLEALLAACNTQALPLIIHGGRNNPYWGGSRGKFGSIGHLREIDFSLSKYPVILAHAALHRCPVQEVALEALPMLKGMLDRHHNLAVDISALGLEQLKLVLESVDHGRILFGSDALYAPQWEAVAMTLHALRTLGMKWEEIFVRLAGANPAKIIFRGDRPC